MGVGVLGEPLTPKIVAAFGRILAGSVLATRAPAAGSPGWPSPAGGAGPASPVPGRPMILAGR